MLATGGLTWIAHGGTDLGSCSMADITMCMNKKCPIRNKCYRAMAIPSSYQSMAGFEYKIVKGKVECDHFWPIENRRTQNG